MNEGKVILVNLAKGLTGEENSKLVGRMVSMQLKLSALKRARLDPKERKNYFLYIDEFQNFATDTFSEILSEARKYGLGLIVAHQFIQQIPTHLSHALFGNVGSLVSFRISSEDAKYMREHFDPYVTAYDLANLSAREAYVKTLVQ